jgi:predicted ArsR family transcriptional regulator
MGGQDLAPVWSLEDPVRRRLYEVVASRSEPVSRDDAAAAAQIGRPLAAYHLDKLVASGLLTVTYRRLGGRSGPGAGRPSKLYAKSDREFSVSIPARDYELAARILTQAVADDPGGTGRTLVQDAANRLGAQLARQGRPGDARDLTRLLSAHGYDPEQEQTDTGTVIELRNCPFHHLAQQQRDVVCGMNLSLIGGMVEGLGLADWQPVLEPKPGECCVHIEERKTPAASIDQQP